jgi:hypothetical protein
MQLIWIAVIEENSILLLLQPSEAGILNLIPFNFPYFQYF